MSLTLNLYYRLKPYIPRRVQIGARRVRAAIKLRSHRDVWPIDEKRAVFPPNWKGWPDGKRFAFILTHDVETAHGQENCRHLIRLEKELGFRSSYNFVPERYEVSEGLRDFLSENGFEVGVHGLKHDGMYIKSGKIILERAEKINRYLAEWKSEGFRMPSTLNNLDLLHNLDIRYDSSTSDTDPFEPQKNPSGTIFPFWVPGRNGSDGFVEIPYTLPQDFTLYVILRQRSIDTWKRKLDWIASKGGMALLLVHPDYIDPGVGESARTTGFDKYPLRFYADFLQYVRDTYKGEYYHALPKELASFWKENFRSS